MKSIFLVRAFAGLICLSLVYILILLSRRYVFQPNLYPIVRLSKSLTPNHSNFVVHDLPQDASWTGLLLKHSDQTLCYHYCDVK
jgi:hypothetical protein